MNFFSITAALMLVTAVAALAQNPSSPMYIPFQAQVTDQEGAILEDNQYSLIFNLYDSPVGGEPVWSERHTNIGVTRGMVNVFLGSIKTLQAVDFSTTKYLGITVDEDGVATTAEPEMVPRSLVVPAFYAKRAEEAVNTRTMDNHGWDAVFENGGPDDGGTIPGAKITKGSVTTSKLELGAVTTGKIENDAVTSAKIVDGEVQNADLAPGVASANLADEGLMAVSAAPTNLRERVSVGMNIRSTGTTHGVYTTPQNRWARVAVSWRLVSDNFNENVYVSGQPIFNDPTKVIDNFNTRYSYGSQEFWLAPGDEVRAISRGGDGRISVVGVLFSNGVD